MLGNADLKAGQLLKIPGADTSANSADTFRPYRPGEIVGDTTPNMPAPPPKKASMFGQLLVIIVMIVVAIYTAGAAAAAMASTGTTAAGTAGFTATMNLGASVMAGSLGTAGTAGVTAGIAAAAGAAGGAVGSIASQAVGVAVGTQEKFSWEGVVMSALSGGTAAGVGALASTTGTVFSGMNSVGRAAVSSIGPQAIGVATGCRTNSIGRVSWHPLRALKLAERRVQC